MKHYLASAVLVAVTCSGLAAQSLPVGFVDVQKVIFGYDKTQQITDALEKRVVAERRAVQQKRDALREKIRGLNALEDPDAETNAALLERIRKERDIALEKVDIELSEKHTLIQLEQDLVEHMKKVYQEIRREGEAVARERGLKAVLMVTDGKVEGRSRSEVSGEILVRPVLWFDPNLDLTAEILRRLNR